MDKSESIAALAAALAVAQHQIEGAVKDKENPAFKGSKYADLENVVEAIREPLAEAGLSYVQVMHDCDGAAKVETVILHKSGEWLSCGAVSVPVSKKDAHGMGSAITYARRYSLSAAFGVAPEDDDGNAAVKKKDTPSAPITPTTGAQEGIPPARLEALQRIANSIVEYCDSGDVQTAHDAFYEMTDRDEQIAVWDLLKSFSGHRRKIKELHEQQKGE